MRLWNLIRRLLLDERGGTGDAVATDEDITAAKMNLKLESVSAGEIDADAIDTDDINPAAGILGSQLAANARKRYAKAYAKLDLSGGAVTDVPILHTTVAVTLVKLILLYTEASSADAGVTVEIGKETDADYHYTGTSETDKALWYEKDATLLNADVGAGDTVICGCAGGKTGTGEILVCLEYTVDD